MRYILPVVILFILLFLLINRQLTHQIALRPTKVITIIASPTPVVSEQIAAQEVLGTQTKTSDCLASKGLPDKACTPGAIFQNATKEQICVSGYSSSVRNVSAAEKAQVYEEYGIIHHATGEYEVDHLISLELGGSNDIANLWPEAAEPTPGFHEKDQVENYLHKQVCNGVISLAQAQKEISADWLSVYNSVPNIEAYEYGK